jgi:hypothetical protein
MDPRIRSAILLVGLVFCLAFGYLTLTVAVDSQFDIFTAASLGIIGLVAAGLIGAYRNPPDE